MRTLDRVEIWLGSSVKDRNLIIQLSDRLRLPRDINLDSRDSCNVIFVRNVFSREDAYRSGWEERRKEKKKKIKKKNADKLVTYIDDV